MTATNPDRELLELGNIWRIRQSIVTAIEGMDELHDLPEWEEEFNAMCERVSNVLDEIRQMPTETIAGAALKARILQHRISVGWDVNAEAAILSADLDRLASAG